MWEDEIQDEIQVFGLGIWVDDDVTDQDWEQRLRWVCAWGAITSSVWTCCVQDVMQVETFLVDSCKYRAEAQGLGATDSNSHGWGSEVSELLQLCA